MQRLKKFVAATLSVVTISSVCVAGSGMTASATGTGAGLAEWALNAYYSGWSYSWGGSSPGAVDCSGLIYSYCGGERIAMIETCTEQGSVSAGIPRIHGLGLWRPGHVGVYIADNMEVDARGDEYGVCYQEIGGWNNWTYWFKLAAVTYPSYGWEEFNGDYYYYEDGQYIVNTSRTIDGTTYYFDSKGRSGSTPSDTSSVSTSGSSGSSETKKSTTVSVWQKGSYGDEVERIQTRLAELGYYKGAIDGAFGDATDAAFRAFQADAGLTVDGIAGSDRNVLYSDDAPYASASNESDSKTEEKSEPETTYIIEEAVNEVPGFTEISTGDFNENVTLAQEQLKELGYFSIDATGYFGEYTEAAVKSFQAANELEETGVIDADTFDTLYSDAAIENPAEEEDVTEETQAEDETTAETAEEAAEAAEETTEAQETTKAVAVTGTVAGPVLPSSLSGSYSAGATVSTSPAVTQSYAKSAATLASKTTKTADNALADSKIAPAFSIAEIKRTANVWMWFVLVALILAVVAFVFFMRDRKAAGYRPSKKKKSMKAQLNARW